MNLSEAITKEIKNKIPMHINIIDKENAEKIGTNTVNVANENKEYTEKQNEKKYLILKIKDEFRKGKSNRAIAIEYGLDRKTIAKYIKTVDIKETSTYDTSNRSYSYLDPYKDEIKELYLQEKSITSPKLKTIIIQKIQMINPHTKKLTEAKS